jgi:hypothetical protein
VTGLALALVGAAWTHGGTDSTTATVSGARIARVHLVDANHDKIFDTLGRRLAGLRRDQNVGVIAVLDRPASPAVVSRLQARVRGLGAVRPFGIVDGFAARATPSAARALARQPEVVHVESDAAVQITNDTPQEFTGIGAARAQVPGLDGDADGNPSAYSKNDMVAAVLDTGIDPNHLDLKGKIIGWKDVVNGRTTPYDDNGHGTHVSATLAGSGAATADRRYRGVAPGAALVGVKVTPADGVAVMSNVVTGLQWVVANKATYNIKAVNLSLGAVGCWDGTEAVSQAVNNTVAAGIVVAVAAGNGGPGICTIKSPGAAARAITVGNMADPGAGGWYLRYDTSRGPTADGRMKPDVSAPGVEVISAQAGTTNGYVGKDGTSMATPLVAGLSLLMLERKPTLTSDQIKDILHSTAVDWGRGGDSTVPGSTGPDVDYGWGRLDGWAALKAAGAPVTTAPRTPGHTELEGRISGTGAKVDFPISIADASFPLAATLTVPGGSLTRNFDLTLLSPSGAQLATSTLTERHDAVSAPVAAPGTYLLRVTSTAGAGDFFLDVSGGFGLPAGNLLVNGSFENGLTGWAGSGATLSVATDGNAGAQAAKVTRTGTATAYSIVSDPKPLSYTRAGQVFSGSGSVRSNAGSRSFCEWIREYSSAGTQLGNASRCITASTGWATFAAFNYTVKQNGSLLELSVTQTSPRTGDAFEVDGLSLKAGAAPADIVRPDTTITGAPGNPSGDRAATFTFASTEAGSTFQCSLDGSGWTACTAPKAYTALALATHTFRVRALDSVGNSDGTPATYTWTIELPWPDTTITSAPANGVTDTGGTFAFASDTANVHYECALDAGAYAACTSPVSYTGLAVGTHTFKVRAVDSVNTPDKSPATATWTIAAAAPAGANLLPNPSFENGTTGWSWFQSALAVATDGKQGAQALSVKLLDGSTGAYTAYPLARPVKNTVVGTPYSATGWLRSDKPGKQICLTLREWSAANVVVASAASCLVTTGTWQQFPPAAYTIKQAGGTLEYFAVQQDGAAGDSFELDAMSLTGPPDTTAPETTITTPPADSGSTTASIPFSANEAATFQCSLDKAPFAACTSPAALTGLALGTHTFAVRATDTAGNVDATPATATWKVLDTAPPNTTIAQGPPTSTDETSAALVFSATEPGTFECSLDNAAFASCSSPQSYDSLAQGAHSVQVRAIDAAGNVDPTPASASWTVVAATFAPVNLLPNGSFESGLDGWTFWQGSLATAADGTDGAQAARVTADPGVLGFSITALPRPLRVGLAAGDTYRATGWLRSDAPGQKICLTMRERDAAGAAVGSDTSCLLSTATWQRFPSLVYTLKQGGGSVEYFAVAAAGGAGDSFEVDGLTLNGPPDSAAPETTITAAPADSARTTGTVSFTASETSTFACSLDGAPFAACTSPVALSGLALGQHTFAVQATDTAGNTDATPATATWQVLPPPDTTAPNTTISQAPPATTADGTALLAFSATEPSTFQCALDGADWVACSSPQGFDVQPGQHSVQIRAVDTAGNVDATPASATWTTVAASPTAPNVLANGSFENGLANWAGWQATLAVATDATDGAQAAQATGAAGVTGFSISASPRPLRTGLVAGDTYAASGWLRSDAPGKKICLTLKEWDSAGAVAGTASSCLVATGTWQRFPSAAYTLKGSGGQLDLFAISGAGVEGESFELDAVTLRVATAPSDTTAPDTTITSAAIPSPTLVTDASFTFTATEVGALQCALDDAPFAACTSPKAYTGLAPGQHTFQVRAVDYAGNVDASPASRTWTVVASPSGPNLLPNGGFEKGLVNWTGSQATLSLATDAQEGTQAAKVAPVAGSTTYTLVTSPRPVRAATVAGRVYGATAWVRSDTPGKKACLKIREWSSTGTSVASIQGCVTLTSTWQQIPQVIYTAQQSGGDVDILLSQVAAVDTDSFEVDGLSLNAG